MARYITKAFRVEDRAWRNFVEAAANYGATPAELLRELVGHVDAAVTGVKSGTVRSYDGDMARLLAAEFPQLSEFQLRTMAQILSEAAQIRAKGRKQRMKEKPGSS